MKANVGEHASLLSVNQGYAHYSEWPKVADAVIEAIDLLDIRP